MLQKMLRVVFSAHIIFISLTDIYIF